MKYLHILALLLFTTVASSCKKNTDKLHFAEEEVITISGVASSYSKITFKGDFVTITPTVTSNKDADFDYFWGIYETSVANGTTALLDTITRTKDLNYDVKLTAKDWVLVFRATNKKTGYSKYVNATLSVGTEFTNGWYVLKDDGGQTDLDFFPTVQSIVPAGTRENVFSVVNGRKLPGKATIFNFYEDYKVVTPAGAANARTLFLVSDQDVSAVEISTLKEIRNFSTLFVEEPAIKKPAVVTCQIFTALYMVNDGQLHSILNVTANTGRFGGRKLKDNQNTPYNLSKYHLIYTIPYFFDETSSSFVSAAGGSNYLTPVADDPATDLRSNNNNKKMIYMGLKTQSPFVGYALFQDKTNPATKTLSSITPSLTQFKIVSENLVATDKIYNGANFALLLQDESMIYFSVGNQIWSRNLSNKFEQLQYTLPAGEEVTAIRHRKYTGAAAFSYNYVMVSSKIGGNYKVRMFTKSSGNLSATPAFTLEGKGAAADAIYIEPNIIGFTYPNTF